MAYFNHAFQKTLLATNGAATSSTNVWDLKDEGPAKVAFIGVVGTNKDKVITPTKSEPFIIAASSIRSKDKLGKFHGGYQEANKSKIINPKFVHRIYRTNPTDPKASYVEVGNVTAEGTCTKQFNCGTYYYLRLDVKGSPVSSVLRHNAYSNVPAYVTCCDKDALEALANDGAEVYIQWAEAIATNPIFEGFVVPAVALDGKYYVADAEAKESFVANYTAATTENTKLFADLQDALKKTVEKAGLVVVGSFEETKFGTCSFKKNDGYNLEPVRIYASEVDAEGEACFNGVCVKEVIGQQGTGFGRSIIDRVILDEAYHQRSWSDCARKREIEGIDPIFSAIDLEKKYISIWIEHSVPRYNNPSSTFDNDNYLIEVVFRTKTAADTFLASLKKLVPDVDPVMY